MGMVRLPHRLDNTVRALVLWIATVLRMRAAWTGHFIIRFSRLAS